MAKLNTKIVMLEGEQGKDGTNIKSVEKSASDGLTDTYTITLTDDSKSSFNVTNGKGISSIEKASTSVLVDTYKITYNDGTTQNYTVNNGKDADLIQSQIVPTASIEMGETASKAYNVGDFLVNNGRGISSISKTGSIGLDDIYTITYNDETTSTFMVPNSKGINLIQNQIVPTASIEAGATASKAYSVGDFLVKDGILYKVTKAISKDDALTAGTNIASTTVGGELSERVQLSLDAVAVGKDEDGDTIYEKTFKGYNPRGATVVDSNLTKSNLKWFRLVGGCFKDVHYGIGALPYIDVNSANFHGISVYSDMRGIYIQMANLDVEMYYFTVQYVLAQ